MASMTQLGHVLMEGIAISLGLDASYFFDRYTREPLTLFRIFNYPHEPAAAGPEPHWGVGEHTDYGLLTILKQDDAGGLEVKSPDGWISAPPLPNSFVCNIGDMLDRMTAGQYRSTRGSDSPSRVTGSRFSACHTSAPAGVIGVRPAGHGVTNPSGDSVRAVV